jgi:hypothetical protein
MNTGDAENERKLVVKIQVRGARTGGVPKGIEEMLAPMKIHMLTFSGGKLATSGLPGRHVDPKVRIPTSTRTWFSILGCVRT